MPAPPNSWAATWEYFVQDHNIPWTDINAAGEALASFWRPLLVTEEGSDAALWSADGWAWSAAI